MERRVLLKLVAAGVIAPVAESSAQRLVSVAPLQAPYKPHVLSGKELDLLDQLCEIIIPADDRSPGARAARVNRYIDVMLSEQDAPVQREWKAGLAAVEDEAQARFSRGFAELNSTQQDQIVAAMARDEEDPHSALEHFFVKLKQMTIDGYHTSEVGIHQEMGYQGNTAVSEFPGCTHPEHKV